MNVFLSYASEDRATAASIHRALLEQGHDVFFDREDLPAGEEFHVRIRRGIEEADLFMFLVSEYALAAGSYTLNEVAIVERTWKRLSGRVLPVMLGALSFERLPLALRAVTVLQPAGDVTAAVADAVHALQRARRIARLKQWALGLGGVALLTAGLYGYRYWRDHSVPVGKDGVALVRVPAGTFTMGDNEYTPQREVYLDAYFMDTVELTVSRYAKFLAATGTANAPEGWQAVDQRAAGEKPVVNVDWHDANAYCRWVGRRLPTSAEWEKAARGTDARHYPWGDASPTLELSNFKDASPGDYDGLTAVDAHPKGRSPYGVYALSGNVSEWVADWYDESYRRGDTRNPQGPDKGYDREIRGGGRFDDVEGQLLSRRYHAAPEYRAPGIGFRCATDASR